MENMQILKSKIKPTHIRNQYRWLNQYGLPMVIHNDFDGLLSGLILHELLGWELVGVYDFNNLWLIKDISKVNDPIYVDLDIVHKNFRSIGHHIIGKEQGEHININSIYGINEKSYKKKYPLSTALFLYWLFEKNIPEKLYQKLFLLNADSSWKNFIEYEDNVINWFNILNMQDLIPILRHNKLKPYIEKYILPNTIGWNHQCSYTITPNGTLSFKESNISIQDYMNYLSRIFNFKQLLIPNELIKKKSFYRQTTKLLNNDINKTIKDLNSHFNIFSYSLKYSDTLDISFY